MRLPTLAAAYALAVAMAGCRRPEPLTARALAASWAFEARDGRTTPLGAEMPDTVRLDSTPDIDRSGRLNRFYPLRLSIVSRRVGAGRISRRLDAAHVVPWPPDWAGYFVMMGWRFGAPDSVSLVFHANMSTSWHYRLRAFGSGGDSLVGRAVMYSDVVSDTEHQVALVGRRTPCTDHSSNVED